MAVLLAACGGAQPLDLDVASLSDDGVTLHLSVDACIDLESLEVVFQERHDEVLVGVRGDVRVGDCGLGMSIVLTEPLGDRKLVDASDGLEVLVRR